MYNISAQATYEKITFVVRNPLFLLLFYKICKLIENTDELIFFENILFEIFEKSIFNDFLYRTNSHPQTVW